MAGPPLALDTLGGRVTFEISAFAMVLAALMNVFLVSRHVRAEEESGRAELIRSTVVVDPEGDLDWVIEAECDLDASDLAGEPVLLATAMRRLGDV